MSPGIDAVKLFFLLILALPTLGDAAAPGQSTPQPAARSMNSNLPVIVLTTGQPIVPVTKVPCTVRMLWPQKAMAGPTLTGGLLRAGLIDEFLVYLAPKLLGAGRGMIDATLSDLTSAWSLRFEASEVVGDDLRILARRPGALDWLG